MRSSVFLTAALATLAIAAPLDSRDAPKDAPISSYGSYGAYGSYGQYNEAIDLTPLVNSAAASPNNFVAITTRSGDTNVHLRSIAASGQRFFIGKDSSTFCPLSNCNDYANITILSARPNDANSNLGLDTNVPGGQAAFVMSDGQLGYTQAHSGATPDGSSSTPFLYTPESEAGRVGSLTFKSGGWAACPTAEPEVYQIYALAASGFSRTDCIGVGISTVSYDGNPAYQYT